MKKYSLFFVVLFLISCNSFNRIDSVFVSDSTAELAITNNKIDSFLEINIRADQDSIYRLLSIVPEADKTTFEFFMKRNSHFYVFQNSEIIYQNIGIQFYPFIQTPSDAHVFYPDKNKTLYQLKLSSTDTIKVLFKQAVKYELSAVFDLADLQSLLVTPKDYSLPKLEFSTPAGLSDTSYSNVHLLKKDSIFVSAQMKIRGSSSKSFPKKQFSIKSRDSVTVNSIALKKAVLYAPYIDRSLIRNKLAYDLFASMSGHSINSFFTHAVINGSYEGIYLLLNHPKTQFKDNVNYANSNSFLVQIDRCPCPIIHNSKIDGFINPAYIFELPSKPSLIQKTAIDSQLSQFEHALYTNDLSEIDLKSFIDLIILNELSKNIDAYRLSTYLAFDGSKMSIPTVWDFNIAWGLAKHAQGFETSGFVINGDNKTYAPFWWQSLWSNPEFQIQLKAAYAIYRETLLSNENLTNYIESLETDLALDKDLNFEKWPLFGKNVWPNKYKSDSYPEEIDRLKEWVLLRVDWLDSQWLD